LGEGFLDYPFEDLGPEGFQQFCQALLLKEFPKLQCFPVAQPDGGRDGLTYLQETRNAKFMVFQVKFARKPLSEQDPHKWLAAILEQEAPKIQTLIPRGASRFLLLTNIPGTSHLDAGSMDRVKATMEKSIEVPSDCWWRDDLSRRLDNAWDLKWAYPALMRGPDLLRAVIESGLSEQRDRRESAVRAFLRYQFSQDEEVRFRQVDLQRNLLDLFIDVPITFRDPLADKRQFFHFKTVQNTFHSRHQSELRIEDDIEFDARSGPDHGLIDSGNDEHMGAAAALLKPSMQQAFPCLVLEGAPGQGKSTISQYICQVHRIRLLRESTANVDPAHLASPMRLPIKVDLRDLATWLGKKDPFDIGATMAPQNWAKTLEAFLAAQISYQSGATHFTVDDVLAVSKISAVLLVFDGLDEVADHARRKDVVEELTRGVQRLQENAASLQVIITSRPAAFANSPGMPHNLFPHFQLLSLPKSYVLLYADRWMRARQLEPRQAGEFRSILKEKLDQPHLRDLARNPMQLTILLSLILTKGSSLPDKRTALYDDYIGLFFSREATKSTTVRDHRDLLIDIHRYLGWLLHSESELGNSRASISLDRLQSVLTTYLTKEDQDTAVVGQLFTGIMERVVALVSRVEGTVEFEVQPLREYFAACHLYYTSPQSSAGKEQGGSTPDRFEALSRNFYWLNVTRFFAGCYRKGELPSLVEGIEDLINSEGFAYLDYPRLLATTLLSDWVFTQVPRSIKKIVERSLDSNGIRYVIAPQWTRRPRGKSNVLSLPPKCGRDELIVKCFELLAEQPTPEFCSQLVDIIRSNSENNTVVATLWKQRLLALPKNLKLLWLEFGIALEILPTISLTELQALLLSLELSTSPEAIPILFRAGRTDYLESSEALFDAAVERILDSQIPNTSRRVESALQALNGSLELFRYSWAFRDRQPVSFAEFSEKHFGLARLIWPENVTTLSETYKSHAGCVTLARIVERESKRPMIEWATELAPWEAVIEGGRSIWGDRRALNALANLSAGIRSNQESCSSFPNLFDQSSSLARRVRYARLRSGSEKWWTEQIKLITSPNERELALLVCLTWAKSSLLLTIHDLLSSQLDMLSKEMWRQVFHSVRHCGALAHQQANDRDELDLPRTIDFRIAAVILDREELKPDVAQQMFKRSMKGLPLDNPTVREFAYLYALDREQIGTPEWKPDLATIRDCYLRGTRANTAFLRPKGKQLEIPLNVANSIAKSPTEYPISFVAAAEERLREEVTRKIVPVAKVAENERWFS
jgi:hypothetical protein